MMKKSLRYQALLVLCLTLFSSAVCQADELVLDGKVTASEAVPVYAAIGGIVDKINFTVGDTVKEDSQIVSLRTTKVYAPSAGTVTGIFGSAGDFVETIVARYGAVLYIEEKTIYTVSASTDNAYNSTDTKFVHIGEKVYLKCRSNASRVGRGTITAVDNTNYTIRVDSGTFIPGDSVDIFRDAKYSSKLRIGRGSVSRQAPTAITGTGSIVKIAVKNGQTVKRGDLLFETLDGTFDGYYMSGSSISAGIAGTVAEIQAAVGSTIQKDSVIASIYPTKKMRIEAELPEEDLASIKEGDSVTVELVSDSDSSKVYEGKISRISSVATASQESTGVTFTVYIDFSADKNVRYGMSAIVTTKKSTGVGSSEPTPDEEVIMIDEVVE